jgi:hypothetical protein
MPDERDLPLLFLAKRQDLRGALASCLADSHAAESAGIVQVVAAKLARRPKFLEPLGAWHDTCEVPQVSSKNPDSLKISLAEGLRA